MRNGWMKGLFLLLSALWSLAAMAEAEVRAGVTGNYYGLQMGGTNLNAESEMLPDSNGNLVLVRPSKKGFGTRLFWGYQFTSHLGLEGGYGYYSPATYNIPNGNSPEVRIQAFDLVGKGTLPLWWDLSAFLKAGMALVPYNQGGLLAPNPDSAHDGGNGITARPVFGLGLSYAFTANMTVDVSVSRITQGGAVPRSDFYAIGLSYHAVDLFCGQFLC